MYSYSGLNLVGKKAWNGTITNNILAGIRNPKNQRDRFPSSEDWLLSSANVEPRYAPRADPRFLEPYLPARAMPMYFGARSYSTLFSMYVNIRYVDNEEPHPKIKYPNVIVV